MVDSNFPTPEELSQLKKWAQDHINPRRALRANIILMLHDDISKSDIVKQIDTTTRVIAKVEHRFQLHHLEGIDEEAPRPGRKISVPDETIEKIAMIIMYKMPPIRKSHWTVRDVALRVNLPTTTTFRIIQNLNIIETNYRDISLQPDGSDTEKASGIQKFLPERQAILHRTNISDVLGIFLCPIINATLFHLELEGTSRSDRKTPTPLNFSEEKMSSLYERREIELMDCIKRIQKINSNFSLKYYDELDFLIFLRTIDKKVSTKDIILLFLTVGKTCELEKIMDWLDLHRRFRIMIFTSDIWYGIVQEQIMSVPEEDKRWVIHQLEQFIFDMNGWGINLGERPIPFLSILKKIKKYR